MTGSAKETIEGAYAKRAEQRELIIQLYSRAYDLIARSGKPGYLVPEDKHSARILSVSETLDGVTFRVHTRPDSGDRIPKKYGKGPDDYWRKVVLDFTRDGNWYLSDNQIAQLGIFTNEGITEERGSEILGQRVSDRAILIDHREGLALTDQVLREVFNA
jgi:hypothetical protein